MSYSNFNQPMGFHPSTQGGRTAAQLQPRPVAASRTPVGAAASADLAIGDCYALDANGNAYHAGADATIKGVVRGFRFAAQPSVMGGNGPVSVDYLPAASAGTVLGIEDPSTLFEVQADTFAVTNIGGSFKIGDTAPDATLRQSRQYINTGAGAGTQFKVVDIVPRPTDNNYGQYAKVLARLLTADLA